MWTRIELASNRRGTLLHVSFINYNFLMGSLTYPCGFILPFLGCRYGITAAGVFPPISVVECLLQCEETENRALWLGCFRTEQQRQILYPQQNPPSHTRTSQLLSAGSKFQHPCLRPGSLASSPCSGAHCCNSC